jgi:cell pole-organizing protein PopZ
MEEILASIRRIIADDEAKPPVAEKPAAPAPPPPKPEQPAAVAPVPKPAPAAMTDIPPSKIPAAVAAAAKAAPSAPPAAPPAAPNNQDDIDALLSGLDDATSADEIRPAAQNDDVEVLELTDEMAVASPPPAPPQPAFQQPAFQRPAFQKIEAPDDIEFTESVASRAINRAPAYELPSFEPAAPAAPSQPILSQSTVSAVESAFNTLAHTVLSNNARTLEDLVKEMLRPLLKSWLDDNLPGLVERIVKAEIERVSRGR